MHRKGNLKTDQACRGARDGAVERVAKFDASIRDIQAKASIDKKRTGDTIEELRIAGAHTDPVTSEPHIKSREVPRLNVGLHLPTPRQA